MVWLEDGSVAELTEKEEIKAAASDKYERRLHQTTESLLMRPPSVNDVQFLGIGPHADAILVGIGTVHADNPSLTTRLGSKKGADPVRIVLDTHLSISPDANILKLDSNSDTILVTGNTVSEVKKKRVVKDGVRLIEQPLKNGQIDMKSLVAQLGSMGITSLLIEGGSQVIASAFSSGIVDKALFFYAPKILGGDDGIPICSGPGAEYHCAHGEDNDVIVFSVLDLRPVDYITLTIPYGDDAVMVYTDYVVPSGSGTQIVNYTAPLMSASTAGAGVPPSGTADASEALF